MNPGPEEQQDLPRLLARLDDLRRAERRAASARMVSVIAHLIGTPLNVISGRAALLRSNTTPEAIEENVRRIEEQVERLSQRIRRLVDYFALAEPPSDQQPLAKVFAECRALYAPVAEGKGVVLDLKAGEFEDSRVEGALLPLLLTTLLSLAIRSATPGRRVELNAGERGPRKLLLSLNLPGVALPPGRLDRLDPPEHGVTYDVGVLETLWICTALARRLGGALEVVPAESGEGVTLHLECPHA
jgi:signal transduction histidine kinase